MRAEGEIRSLRAARDELANEGGPFVDRGLGNANEGVVRPFVDVPQLFAERHRVVERHDPLFVGRIDVAPWLEEQHVTLIPKRLDGCNARRDVRPGSDGVDDAIGIPRSKMTVSPDRRATTYLSIERWRSRCTNRDGSWSQVPRPPVARCSANTSLAGSSTHPNSPLSRLRMAVFPDPGEPVRMTRFAPELRLTAEE